MKKECTKCGDDKDFDEFYKNKTKKYGIQSACKECEDEVKLKTKRTIEGLASDIFNHQLKSSRKRNHPNPTYTRSEFKKFALASSEYHELFMKWVESDYDKWTKPSFDRKKDNLPYSFGNFNRWMTWQENADKAHIDSKDGKLITGIPHRDIICIHKKTRKRSEFHSTMEAERKLGVCHSSISQCCLGRQKSAGDYYWEYNNKKGFVFVVEP